MVFGFIRRLLGRGSRQAAAPRALLSGTVRVAEREWSVREERRAGAWPQLLILSDGERGMELHLRIQEGQEVGALEGLAARAEDPTAVWFSAANGARWEARIVWSDAPDGKRLKFLCWPGEVCEIDYPFEHGLGRCTDVQLREALEFARSHPEG